MNTLLALRDSVNKEDAKYKSEVEGFVRKVAKEGGKRKPKITVEVGLLLYNNSKDLNKTLASIYNI